MITGQSVAIEFAATVHAQVAVAPEQFVIIQGRHVALGVLPALGAFYRNDGMNCDRGALA